MSNRPTLNPDTNVYETPNMSNMMGKVGGYTTPQGTGCVRQEQQPRGPAIDGPMPQQHPTPISGQTFAGRLAGRRSG